MGLRENDCEGVPVDAEFPRAGRISALLRMDWLDQATRRWYVGATSATANRRLRAAGSLDGVVMIGTGYLLSPTAPMVTYEDMTTVQLMRLPGSRPDLAPRAMERWRARQLETYRRCRACCVASRWAGDSVRDDYGVPDSKIRVVGFGINAKGAPPVDRDWSVPRFLFLGFDWKRKRGAAVVEAFAEVRKRYPQASLDLVGGHPQVDAEGVIGHGPLPLGSADGQRRLRELLERDTCLVMPSRVEPYGIAYLDAAAVGMPSIGTTVGGAPDAVGEAGRVVDPEDQRALVNAMLELSDPATARELGAIGHARSPELTWKAVAARVLAALREEPAQSA